ncbi:unnamed protein product [Rotaria socialis]|uniref:Methionine aminopeptidase n=1 Tax=Rotaria socialis TaxID=392032 RepID=A0A817SD67_9BILA|nr:unnamed protein product [Rotaria socialis]
MATAIIEDHLCVTPNCGGKAKLRCPNCVKLGIVDGSYFCSQDCFKSYWSEHKKLHVQAKNSSTANELLENYNPWPGFHFTGKLRPYPQTPRRMVPPNIARPDYADDFKGRSKSEEGEKSSSSAIRVLIEDEQDLLRDTCKVGRIVLDEAARSLRVGMTTEEIDRIVHECCIEHECYPSPLNYYEFPKSCCTSINEVICHGIPDLRPLQDGDIVNIDISVYKHGFHSDLNETFFIGNVDQKSRDLVRTAYECLDKAAALIRPGTKYRDIGNEIQKHATANGCSVVRSYCGHGVHRLFHCAPNIPHYAKNKAIGVMKPGHAFTIEPMINAGTWRDVLWNDNWTSVTEDGQRSAQFEHTFLVTDTGCDTLTARASGQPWFLDGNRIS